MFKNKDRKKDRRTERTGIRCKKRKHLSEYPMLNILHQSCDGTANIFWIHQLSLPGIERIRPETIFGICISQTKKILYNFSWHAFHVIDIFMAVYYPNSLFELRSVTIYDIFNFLPLLLSTSMDFILSTRGWGIFLLLTLEDTDKNMSSLQTNFQTLLS